MIKEIDSPECHRENTPGEKHQTAPSLNQDKVAA
jgi:hypothetical protein